MDDKHDTAQKTVYWHRELPPISAELMAEQGRREAFAQFVCEILIWVVCAISSLADASSS